MNFLKLAPVALASLALLAGCKGGPEGTYKLDKESMKTAMKAEIEKMPKEQQAGAELGMAIIEMMDMTIEIKSDGKYEAKTSMPDLMGKDKEAKKEETESGDWKVEGDKITLKGKKDLTCKFDSSKIECEGDKKGAPSLVFKKS
ncbi:MAG: copper resistance protein NlpE N-terminal domain-containing protein [Myxococcales bacterium]|nr:copper resistance protein NlpE N-terminal domain-containing protein [Myxococcales bacterium]